VHYSELAAVVNVEKFSRVKHAVINEIILDFDFRTALTGSLRNEVIWTQHLGHIPRLEDICVINSVTKHSRAMAHKKVSQPSAFTKARRGQLQVT